MRFLLFTFKHAVEIGVAMEPKMQKMQFKEAYSKSTDKGTSQHKQKKTKDFTLYKDSGDSVNPGNIYHVQRCQIRTLVHPKTGWESAQDAVGHKGSSVCYATNRLKTHLQISE